MRDLRYERIQRAKDQFIRAAAVLTEPVLFEELTLAMQHAVIALVHLRALDVDGRVAELLVTSARREIERRKGQSHA